MKFDYYKAPSNEVFKAVKEGAIKVWSTYDNEFGYVDEKVNRIKDIKNIKDNACYIVAMFDTHNQIKLLYLLEGEAKVWMQSLIDYSNEEMKKLLN